MLDKKFVEAILTDIIAITAMHAMVRKKPWRENGTMEAKENLARGAYNYARAMLRARNGEIELE